MAGRFALPGEKDEDMRPSSSAGNFLFPHQTLATSGARGVTPYMLDGALYLAVPQLAEDVPGTPVHINGGTSDIASPIYRWQDGRFVEDIWLPIPGGEDIHLFRIGDTIFMATASLRVGHGPYDLNCESVIFTWTGKDWARFQSFATFAAKQWHHFRIGERHFLALAQGVTESGHEAAQSGQSCIFEWDGTRFVAFQTLNGMMGYNWESFSIGKEYFLAYADHTSASGLYRWTGDAFAPFQIFSDHGGRAFRFFEEDGQCWLAFANLMGDSTLYRWNAGQFEATQRLGGPGGREFALFRAGHALYLVRVCFIQGSKLAPKPDLLSQVYHWRKGGFVLIEEFPTFGATEAAAFEADGQWYLAVANSLSRALRFREDTVIYRLNL
ncbi:MAG: hypothetical protein JWR80_8311 [Bradyrhizobium sp.]|nr:hypothetical protein [Bradyrhizobium sp.]